MVYPGDTYIAISIHAAQEGCDFLRIMLMLFMLIFQSTQPKRAATATGVDDYIFTKISIHAAQEGCDLLVHLFASSGL